MEGDRKDFFVSHAGADRAWAEWVAWQLTDAGYTVELDVWDWAAGQNFMTAMSDALDRCDRVVALFSAAYFERERYTIDEWRRRHCTRPVLARDAWFRCGWRTCLPRGFRPFCGHCSSGICSESMRSTPGAGYCERWRAHEGPITSRCSRGGGSPVK